MTATASPDRSTPRRSRRAYHSPLRAQRSLETRAALIAAARQLFLETGWAATGMRDVAVAAGVATETVYAYFSSKRNLLQAVIDIEVVGDEQPVALAERPEFAALARGTRAERCAAAARLLANVHQRTVPFAKLIREAAHTDQEMAGVLDATRERQRRDVAAALELMVGEHVDDDDRDGVWAIACPEIYELLVEVSGWTRDQYERWMARTLKCVVPKAPRKTPRRSTQ